MAFSEATKMQALARAGSRCECKRANHIHAARCKVALTKARSEFHHKLSKAKGGGDGLSNCEVLCKTCHALVRRPH
jgi:5-methylcytosine-specific restriction endonuclease McrA